MPAVSGQKRVESSSDVAVSVPSSEPRRTPPREKGAECFWCGKGAKRQDRQTHRRDEVRPCAREVVPPQRLGRHVLASGAECRPVPPPVVFFTFREVADQVVLKLGRRGGRLGLERKILQVYGSAGGPQWCQDRECGCSLRADG